MTKANALGVNLSQDQIQKAMRPLKLSQDEIKSIMCSADDFSGLGNIVEDGATIMDVGDIVNDSDFKIIEKQRKIFNNNMDKIKKILNMMHESYAGRLVKELYDIYIK